MRVICFLSDFGLADDFVGTCKGVMLSIAPGIYVVDLTHEVPGFGVEPGAEILQHATRYMPEGAIYLAVVDPGVGTERRAVALRTESDAFMVGPDNGLLVPAASHLGGISEVVLLTNERYHVHPVSSTFHGRDVFAPAAAYLAAGVGLPELGEGLEARIIAVDRYGNARLSVTQEGSGLEYGAELKVDAGDGGMSVRFVETFGSAKAGELVLVPDSHWRLSLAVNKGNAARALGLKVGGRVLLVPAEGPDDDGT